MSYTHIIICIVGPFSRWAEKLCQMELLWISVFFSRHFFWIYERFGFCRFGKSVKKAIMINHPNYSNVWPFIVSPTHTWKMAGHSKLKKPRIATLYYFSNVKINVWAIEEHSYLVHINDNNSLFHSNSTLSPFKTKADTPRLKHTGWNESEISKRQQWKTMNDYEGHKSVQTTEPKIFVYWFRFVYWAMDQHRQEIQFTTLSYTKCHIKLSFVWKLFDSTVSLSLRLGYKFRFVPVANEMKNFLAIFWLRDQLQKKCLSQKSKEQVHWNFVRFDRIYWPLVDWCNWNIRK